MNTLRSVDETVLDALEVGAAILGTGGGGNPYIGKLRCLQELRKGHRIPVIPLQELEDDALVVSLGGIGAPLVSIEKFEQGHECLRALQALEQELDCRVDALISSEIGGANSMEPMLTAAQAGLPVVDGDGMGRAFPEMQMCTWSIYGHRSVPAAMSDEKGSVVVFRDVPDELWLERLARATVVAMGATAGIAMAPMRGSFVKRAAVPDTLTLAWTVGQAVLDSQQNNQNPIKTVLQQIDGQLLMTGKITDLKRELRGGFSVGHIQVGGLEQHAGEMGQIDLQNEFLVFRRNQVVEASVPDLIIVLDIDTGMPITTELLRYGQRIAVIAAPCHPLLRTGQALAVIGPAAFGYDDIEYRPLGSPR